jgi:hypothetical protein
MKKIILFYMTLFLSSVLVWGQAADSLKNSSELLPSGLHFRPLLGNQQEAHFGILYYTETSNLKVDIGNSIDVVSFMFPADSCRLTFGIDFMAYAYSTSYKGNRLQIDALDGFFGGNAVFSKKTDGGRLIGRFRVTHNSAHLVDGHFDQATDKWIGDKKPIPFTKDFGELLLANERLNDKYLLKYYGGVSYSTLVRPIELKKYAFIGGVETGLIDFWGKVMHKETELFLSYNINLIGIPKYVANNNIMLGTKFGAWNDKGLMLYLDYYSGQNFLSEYYKDRISRFGIGFLVDF